MIIRLTEKHIIFFILLFFFKTNNAVSQVRLTQLAIRLIKVNETVTGGVLDYFCIDNIQ